MGHEPDLVPPNLGVLEANSCLQAEADLLQKLEQPAHSLLLMN